MTLPKISIIIPTKNSSKTLDVCLNSIVKQTYKDYEIIIVDNYSNDDTINIASRYTEKIFKMGPERSSQVNFGVQQANGKYVYRVDGDFVLEPNVLKESFDKCENENFDALVIHNISDPSVSIWSKVRNFERDMYLDDKLNVAARFFRKSVFEEIGGFDENMIACEDYDLHNRLLKTKYKMGRIKSNEIHLGEPKTLLEIVRKHYYYGKSIDYFLKKNPRKGIKQLSPVRPAYLKNWRMFFTHPKLTVYFTIYQLARYSSSIVGYLIVKLRLGSKELNISRS